VSTSSFWAKTRLSASALPTLSCCDRSHQPRRRTPLPAPDERLAPQRSSRPGSALTC
jgi:hypothetical protein